MEKVDIKDLPKLSTETLEEMLQRQNRILGKSCVVCKLIDKGESVRKFRSAILAELDKRKIESQLTESLSELNIAHKTQEGQLQTTEKHVQYVCTKEQLKPVEHFRPFLTLKHEKENIGQSSSTETTDVDLKNKPHTKLIPLNESLVLQINQAKRVKDEQMKKYLGKLDFFEGSEEAEEEPDPESQLVILEEDAVKN